MRKEIHSFILCSNARGGNGHGGCQLGHSIQPAGSLDRVAQFILPMDAPQQIPFHAVLSAEAFTLPSLACASVGHSSAAKNKACH
jgi:hypothetical protein